MRTRVGIQLVSLVSLTFLLFACDRYTVTDTFIPQPSPSIEASRPPTAASPTLAPSAIVMTPSPPPPTRPSVALPLGEGRIIFAADPGGKYKLGIYEIDVDGLHALTKAGGKYVDYSPAWSPDGGQIAFAAHVGDGHDLGNIYLMNADGTGRQKLTDFQFGADLPSWSPEGTQIVFQGSVLLGEGRRGVQTEIFVINVDGSGLTNLTNTTQDEMDPDWSPDGQKIVFASGEGICVMDVDGGDREVIVPDNDGRSNSAPSWSPDGRRIAFHSFGGDWQIYLVDPDGENLTRLTDLDLYGVSCPTWSPDGKKIAFQAGWVIYILDIASGNLTKLVQGAGPNWH